MKKWIDKKNFNIFVGKASSLRNSFQNEIKNYDSYDTTFKIIVIGDSGK